ncbi:MAG TPA: NADH-quinone oxidoreductase subunit H [Polyangia bacterium]|jgi:Formate hydrogenlyase subunit 4|nr:NADH-quinone oxidoreductase subunit H [Polyangia bacterium]
MGEAAQVGKVVAQAGLLVLLGPLVTGFIQKLKARLQCRQGASLWQPYRDLAKLLRKGTVQSDSASPFFRAIPVLVLAVTVTTTVMLPVLWAPAGPVLLPLGDSILLLALLALARFLCAIGALDAGGAFGGMGASREMTVGLLVEPAMMMAVFSVAVAGGTTDLVQLAARRGTLAALSWQAPDLLALFAMLVLALAETGRIPVDNPDTHLELTMLHEGMLLEHSGPGLACIVLATHTKQIVILTLVAALFFPPGLAQGSAPLEIALAVAAFLGKILALAIFLGLVESSYAKLRFFRVPQFLGLGLVCAFLALALRIL